MEYTFIGLVLLIIVFLGFNKLKELEVQMNRMQFTLDQLAKTMEIPEHPVNDEIRKLLKEEKLAKAVKRAREELGLSLVEGKKYIDKLNNGEN